VSLEHFEVGDRTIHPVVTLKNGLRVANFSSPHSFTFSDGTILPACPPDTVEAGKLIAEEKEKVSVINNIEFTDVDLEFRLSESCKIMLRFLTLRKDVDIILVPLPVLECIKKLKVGWEAEDINYNNRFQRDCLARCRVVRVKDRQTKVIYSDRFCI